MIAAVHAGILNESIALADQVFISNIASICPCGFFIIPVALEGKKHDTLYTTVLIGLYFMINLGLVISVNLFALNPAVACTMSSMICCFTTIVAFSLRCLPSQEISSSPGNKAGHRSSDCKTFCCDVRPAYSSGFLGDPAEKLKPGYLGHSCGPECQKGNGGSAEVDRTTKKGGDGYYCTPVTLESSLSVSPGYV